MNRRPVFQRVCNWPKPGAALRQRELTEIQFTRSIIENTSPPWSQESGIIPMIGLHRARNFISNFIFNVHVIPQMQY